MNESIDDLEKRLAEKDREAAEIRAQIAKIEWPKTIEAYLHGSKESGWDLGQELGLEGKALDAFSYLLYEVEFELEVYKDGTYKIVKVDGRKLAD